MQGRTAPVLSPREIRLIMASLLAALFLSSLNQTVVGTAMRTIADDLGGVSLQAWVTTAFLIASTVSTPIYGKLSDIFGRRPLLLAAMTLFVAGSLLATTSLDMIQLAAYRGVQGLGAGGLMSLPLAIIADVLSPAQRAKVQGLFMAVFGVSSVAGPLVGGLLAGIDEVFGVTGWRWVFLISVPLGLVAFILTWRYLHLPKVHGSARIDWFGSALVVLVVVPLILVAEQGTHWGWASPTAITCYLTTVVSLIIFVFVERRMGDDAIIPLSLFRIPTFSVAVGVSVLVGFGMFLAMIILPLYMQIVLRLGPTAAGLALLPQVFAQLISSLVVGFVVAKLGRTKPLVVGGTALLLVAYWLLTTSQYDQPVWRLYLPMVLFGVSLGALLQSLTLTLQSAVEPDQMGVASSSSAFFRSIGGTFGTGIGFSVLFGSLPLSLSEALERPDLQANLQQALSQKAVRADPDNAVLIQILQSPPNETMNSLNGDTSFLMQANDQLAAPFLWAFNESTVQAFWFGLAMVAAALALSFLLPNTRLGDRSALQELHDRSQIAPPSTAGDAPTGTIPIVLRQTDTPAGGSTASRRRKEPPARS